MEKRYKPIFNGFDFNWKYRDVAKYGDKNIIIVTIQGEEYNICSQTTASTDKKTGVFGAGLINNQTDIRKVQRTGMLGEMAVAKIFNTYMDLTYREHGDECDFLLNGLSTDVKCAASYYGANCIRVRARSGANELNWKKQQFISAHIIKDDLVKSIAEIAVVGWNTLEEVMMMPEVPARRGFHINREINFRDTHPIAKLCDLHAKYSIIPLEDYHANGVIAGVLVDRI